MAKKRTMPGRHKAPRSSNAVSKAAYAVQRFYLDRHWWGKIGDMEKRKQWVSTGFREGHWKYAPKKRGDNWSL